MINFYCVTLENNRQIIERNLYKLKKFYPKFSYTIITPKESYNSFLKISSKFNCKIINENDLISKSYFEHLIHLQKSEIEKNKKKKIFINRKRINWYYQ